MGQLLWPADAKQRAAVCCHCAADAAAPDAGNERAGTGLRVWPAQLPAFPPGAGLGGYGFFAQNDRPSKAETPRGGAALFGAGCHQPALCGRNL